MNANPAIAGLTNPEIHNYLIRIDPPLSRLFNTIGPDVFTGLPKPPYVSLIGAVIGQIVRYTHAKSVRSKLYQVCGNNFNHHTINTLKMEHWKYIGLDMSKVEIVLHINQYIENNNITLNTLEEIKSLRQIKGVGEWTINTTILTSFMDWDTFPCGDLFIRKRIQKLYKLKKVPTIADVRKISERWKPYRTIVAWYLWRWFE